MSGLCTFLSRQSFLSYSFLRNRRLEIILNKILCLQYASGPKHWSETLGVVAVTPFGSVRFGLIKFGRFLILSPFLSHSSPVGLCCLIYCSSGSFLLTFLTVLGIIFCLLTREVTYSLAVLALTCRGYALAWHAMFGQHYPVGRGFPKAANSQRMQNMCDWPIW